MDFSHLRRTLFAGFMMAGLALPVSTLADSPSYNFFEIGYVNGDIDNPDVDGDGFGIGGSVSVHENWFLFAEYASFGFDFDVDLDTFEAGAGFRLPMSDTTDFAFTASYVRAEADVPGFGSEDDDGYGVGVKVRSMVSDVFELNGGINYVDLGGSDGDDTSFEIGGLYSFSDNFAFGARADIGDDLTVYQVGFRFYFDK